MLKERLPKEVRLNGTCSSGADDDRNDRVLLRVVQHEKCRADYDFQQTEDSFAALISCQLRFEGPHPADTRISVSAD